MDILNFDDYIIARIILFAPLWIQVRMRETCKRIRAIIDREIVREYRDPMFEQSRGFAPDEFANVLVSDRMMLHCALRQRDSRMIVAHTPILWDRIWSHNIEIIAVCLKYAIYRSGWDARDLQALYDAVAQHDSLAQNHIDMIKKYVEKQNCDPCYSFRGLYNSRSCADFAKISGMRSCWNDVIPDLNTRILCLGYAAKYGRFAQFTNVAGLQTSSPYIPVRIPLNTIRAKMMARTLFVSRAHPAIVSLAYDYCRERLTLSELSSVVDCAKYVASYGYFDIADSIIEMLRAYCREHNCAYPRADYGTYKTFIVHARGMNRADYDRYLQFTTDDPRSELRYIIYAHQMTGTSACHGDYFEMIRAMIRYWGRDVLMNTLKPDAEHAIYFMMNPMAAMQEVEIANSILVKYILLYNVC